MQRELQVGAGGGVGGSAVLKGESLVVARGDGLELGGIDVHALFAGDARRDLVEAQAVDVLIERCVLVQVKAQRTVGVGVDHEHAGLGTIGDGKPGEGGHGYRHQGKQDENHSGDELAAQVGVGGGGGGLLVRHGYSPSKVAKNARCRVPGS